MKIETTKQIGQAKMLKSDLWVSKKNVSSIFKVVVERSFTMSAITQGFRKCGIYPFDPNEIDKTLLLRGCKDAKPENLDLSSSDETTPGTDDDSLVSEAIISSLQPVNESEVTTIVELEVGTDGILSPVISNNSDFTASPELTVCPPDLALSAVETSLTPRKKRRYEEAFFNKNRSNGR